MFLYLNLWDFENHDIQRLGEWHVRIMVSEDFIQVTVVFFAEESLSEVTVIYSVTLK